jgi:leucyl aminopeptidase
MPDCLLPPEFAGQAVPVDAVAAGGLAAFAASRGARARDWIAATGFKAEAGAVLTVPSAEGGVEFAILGLGDDEGVPSLKPGRLPAALPDGTYRLRDGFADPPFAALAFALGAYRFRRYRIDKGGRRELVLPPGAADAVRIADAVYMARDLINTGANDLGPAELADAAATLAGRHGASFRVIVGDALLAEGFPLIHAVGAAAVPERAPRLIDFSWGDPAHPRLTVVGKGVCFDTGGLDLKPSAGMLLMKKDMGGAANALALAQMIMDAGLKVRLRVLIPAVENAVSGAAFRPGDVLRSRKGLSVEIGNTDAEGRLVLADALSLAAEEQPSLLVDLATLTGAARVALGPEVVPFYATDDGLADAFQQAGTEVADPVWRLPLWKPYASMLESKVADINNAGPGSYAGSITAALFLRRFVPDDIRWLHADIFAWNPVTQPGRPEGGEAQAVRALYRMLGDAGMLA